MSKVIRLTIFGFTLFILLYLVLSVTPASHASMNLPATGISLGSISGKVTDEQGKPLRGIEVTAYVRQTGSPFSSNLRTRTDSTGVYTLAEVPAGGYGIRFVDLSTPRQYTNEYYNHALAEESASEVLVSANTIVTNINAVLASTGIITGAVIDQQGKPLATIYVNGYVLDGTGHWQVSDSLPPGVTDAHGIYTLTAVDAGTYRIGFFDTIFPLQLPRYEQQYYNQVGTVEAAIDIVVQPGQTVGGINGQLITKGMIRGKVTDQEGNPLSDISVLVYSDPDGDGQFSWDIPHNYKNGSFTDMTGAYEVFGLDKGSYRLEYTDPIPVGFSSEFYSHALTITQAQTIVVPKDGVVEGINAQLVGPTGRIAGRVTNTVGQPLQNIVVTAYHTPDGSPGLVRSIATTENGTYTLTGLPNGVYRVGFFDRNPSNSFLPDRYATSYYDNADSYATAKDITVKQKQTVNNINAQLLPSGRIAGRLTDLAGNPLAGIDVLFHALTLERGWIIITVTKTDADGTYSVGLDDDAYRLKFADTHDAPRYISMYYHNASSLESTADIRVQRGITNTVDIQQLTPISALNQSLFLVGIQN